MRRFDLHAVTVVVARRRLWGTADSRMHHQTLIVPDLYLIVAWLHLYVSGRFQRFSTLCIGLNVLLMLLLLNTILFVEANADMTAALFTWLAVAASVIGTLTDQSTTQVYECRLYASTCVYTCMYNFPYNTNGSIHENQPLQRACIV